VCGIRPAYLIDTLILQKNELELLVKALRAVRFYQSMSHEQENSEVSALLLEDQIFVIHESLLKDALGRFIEGTYCPISVDFPSLSRCNQSAIFSLRDIAKDIIKTLEQDRDSSIIDVVGMVKSLPSLAGLLLSYPAVYYSEDVGAKLMDTEVKVVSVCAGSFRVLMQFSCPTYLLNEVRFDLESIVKEWESRISSLTPLLLQKWRTFTGVESCTLKIQIETCRVPILSL
jgi:hypothetical protein